MGRQRAGAGRKHVLDYQPTLRIGFDYEDMYRAECRREPTISIPGRCKKSVRLRHRATGRRMAMTGRNRLSCADPADGKSRATRHLSGHSFYAKVPGQQNDALGHCSAGFGRALASRALWRSLSLISSACAQIMQGNRDLTAPNARTNCWPTDVGEAVEGLVIKWFLLAGMLGSVVCAFVIA
jgi:hypothetical protein